MQSTRSAVEQARRASALESIDSMRYFRQVDWLDSIDSTNKHVARGIREKGSPLPWLVVADRQSAGVGRGANRWWSPEGCLMFSMAVPLLEPTRHDTSESAGRPMQRLPLEVGLAAAEALGPVVRFPTMIKWPNDLVIDDRKAGGILIESLNTELGSVAIIGIGINCRVDFQLAPLELREQGVSIHEVAREDQHESVWAESVLVRFLERWCDVRDRQPSTPDWLDREWPKRCWLTGKRVEVQNAAGRMQGTVVGLDPSGALLIQREGSGVTPVISGTVRVIGHPPRRSSSQDTPHPE